jgi:L-fuconolactonase
MLVVDAQVHIWDRDRPERPWPIGASARAHRLEPLTADELVREMGDAGVDRVILVPPSWEGDRNEIVLDACRAHPDRFRAIGRVSPYKFDDTRALAGWRDQAGMLGFRLTLHLPGQLEWLSDGRLSVFWKEAERSATPVMIYAPRGAEEIGRIARAHPDLRIIVDHLGLGLDVRNAAVKAELEPVLALAPAPNIAVKISALPCHTDDAFPFRSLRADIERAIDAFGASRCLWGSDLSRLPCPYAEWVEVFLGGHISLSSAELEWIMGRSAIEWLGWREQPSAESVAGRARLLPSERS